MKYDEQPEWEAFVDRVIKQQLGMEDPVKYARLLRSDLLQGEGAIVVYGERPFYESIPSANVTKKGQAAGWIGTVDSFELTNTQGSNLLSPDGRSYARIQLVGAQPFTHNELRHWDAANTSFLQSYRTNCLDSFFKSIQRKRGDTLQTALIYQPYFNVDYIVLPKEDDIPALAKKEKKKTSRIH